MQKLGENKAVGSGETKGPVKIKYIGHKEAVYVSSANEWPETTFKRDVAVEVGATLAAELLKQPDKFKAAA
jgi:hypothetical protein